MCGAEHPPWDAHPCADLTQHDETHAAYDSLSRALQMGLGPMERSLRTIVISNTTRCRCALYHSFWPAIMHDSCSARQHGTIGPSMHGGSSSGCPAMLLLMDRLSR